MAALTFKIIAFVVAVLAVTSYRVTAAPQYQQQYQQQYQPQQYQQAEPAAATSILDIETPTSFSYNSPLRQPDSLRNRPYFDFLSTLYRRDSAKSDLFRPYARTSRDVAHVVSVAAPVDDHLSRQRRAIVFRPLFVYKQQQIRKEQYNQSKRRRI